MKSFFNTERKEKEKKITWIFQYLNKDNMTCQVKFEEDDS